MNRFRRRLPLLALVTAVGCLTAGCDWAMFGFNATNVRASGENTVAPQNRAAFSGLFTGTTGNEIHSSAAIVKGVAYIGSDDHKLYAFDAGGATNCTGAPASCTPLWTANTG